MLQYKRKRTGTSLSNPNAKENAESLTAARKRGTTTLQNIGGQPSGEEKSDQSSDDQSSEMEKNSKNNSNLSGEEKSDENSNENSSEEKKDGESHGDESSREEQSEESESEQSDEKEEEDHLSVSGSYDSRINARVGFGAQFVEFRKILIAQKIENDFKKSCFGHFLKLDQSVAVQLPMKLVHGLCLRRIFSEKKKEVWIDYNVLPLCFGINEFVIMTGLRCHSLPPLSQQLAKIEKEGEILIDLVGQSANVVVLIEKMSDPCLTKKQKLAISMVWFLHCVLCSKSAEKKIETHWLKMASKKKLDSTKSQYNLHGCPWAFAAWAFEAIPALQRLAKDSSPEKSIPRMIKWMAGTPAYKTNIDPIYQKKEQMQNQVVHHFLFPTNIEKEQIYVQDIESYEDSLDPKIDALKEELALVTAIKLNITVVEEGLKITGGENSVARNYGVERDGRDESHLADLGRGEDTPGVIKTTNVNAFNIDCCCKCETCCDKYETLLNEVKSLSTKLDGQQSKRTIYSSYARKSPYTLALKRRLAMNSKAKNAMKSRLEVNLYKPLDVEKREIFNHVDEILSLMRKRQIWYPNHYDQTDLILDLNFYNTLYDQYNNLREKSLVNGAPLMHEALTSFEMDGDILKYCKGEMSYPYGRKWNEAKIIYTVMNIKNTHFIALEFLMEKGLIQVYDCNIHMCDEPTFLTLIQPILELWPKLLKQSGINNSRATCGPYTCVFIDHLLTGTDMSCLNDNDVNNFRMKYYFVFLLSTTLIVSTTASIVPVSASVVRTTGSIVPITTLVVRTTGSIVSTTSLVVPATGLVVPPIL
ncbi:hypothetical protein H5410_047591 [Solanum commersonii]|uniref:Ubiquitin-like protease family profile domain-containing protein n=1 Tax=Solanum commersonii TaxID=4109 RepID=A0A9J5XHF8_SOLCO|nr:hypothetical protein H5410_047591 [Solanum commersonii]